MRDRIRDRFGADIELDDLPDHALLGVIRMPEIAGNLNWGGGDWTDLYCACSSSIYRVRMKVRGNPVAYMRPL